MQPRPLLAAGIVAIALAAQDSPRLKIEGITVRGEPPLKPATCIESSYGYLHIGYRGKLTPAEIGQYIIDDTADGKVITIYPESKSGIFAYADCLKR